MSVKRGVLVLAPMCVGKSYAIKNLGLRCLDGDELCALHGIYNKNFIWYAGDHDKLAERRRQDIINLFEQYLDQGYNVIYSGNPYRMQVYYLVMIDVNQRYENCQKRKATEWAPSDEQFYREQEVYESYIKDNHVTVFNSFQELNRHLR